MGAVFGKAAAVFGDYCGDGSGIETRGCFAAAADLEGKILRSEGCCGVLVVLGVEG